MRVSNIYDIKKTYLKCIVIYMEGELDTTPSNAFDIKKEKISETSKNLHKKLKSTNHALVDQIATLRPPHNQPITSLPNIFR